MARMILLKTERLVLRRFEASDVDNLYELDSDPAVMRYLTGGVPHTREFISQRVLPHYLSFYQRSKHFGFWAAIERNTGVFMGWFHFRPFKDDPDEIELGYRLKRNFWGKEFAVEGSTALIAKGFEEWSVDKVVATTMTCNTQSRRVMEKLGMQLEKEFAFPAPPFPGWRVEDCLEVKYGVSRTNWEANA